MHPSVQVDASGCDSSARYDSLVRPSAPLLKAFGRGSRFPSVVGDYANDYECSSISTRWERAGRVIFCSGSVAADVPFFPFSQGISDFLLVASGTLIGGSIGHVLQLSQTFKLSLNELFFGSLIYSCIVICFLQSDNAYPRVCSLLHVKETETVLRVSIKAILAGLVLCIVARYPVPRMAMLVAWSVGTISLTVGRVWVQESARKHLAPTIPQRRSLIYGTKRTARRFFTSALHSPMLGINPIGFVGSASESGTEIFSNDYFQSDSRPIFREQLSVDLLKRKEIKDIYVCDTSISEFGLRQVREVAQAAGCSLSLVDDQEILANSMPTCVWEMDGLFVATAGLNEPGRFYRGMKRLLDLVCRL